MSNARFSILQSKAVSDKGISNAQFRTLAALGMFGNKDGWCFPKLKTLSEILGKSRQAISMDLKELESLGYIEIKHQFHEDGSQKFNLYRLIFDSKTDNGLTPPEPGLTPPEYPLSSEVDGGLSSEVDALTPQVNAPSGTSIKNNNKEAFAKICKFYEQEIGPLTGMISDEISLSVEEYPIEWFQPAFREAAMAQARNWKYVLAILKNWKSHGYGWKPKKPGDRLKTGTQLRNL